MRQEQFIVNYRISEIFYSIQGEGCLVGIPTVFIRLYGCNLKCDFCDTNYAWDTNIFFVWDVRRIIEEVKELSNNKRIRWVCITGGEPTLQDLEPLVRGLKDEGFLLSLETNGSNICKDFFSYYFDWISVGIKGINVFNDTWFKTASEFKIIVNKFIDNELIDFVLKGIEKRQVPIFLQPCDNDIRNLNLIRNYLFGVKDSRLRLGFQLHKIVKVR